MKKFTLILLPLLATVTAMGQNDSVYQSVFGQQQADWIIHYIQIYPEIVHGRDTVWFPSCAESHGCYVDSNVSSPYEGYHPLHESRYASACGQLNGILFNTTFSHYLRETDNNSKLYLRPAKTSDTEILLMDLNLSVGDTFPLQAFEYYFADSMYSNSVGPLRTHLYVVDSVYYNEDRKHVRLNYTANFPEEGVMHLEFIEGIGPSFSIFYPFLPPRYMSNSQIISLGCYFRDSVREYHHSPILKKYTDWDRCYIWMLSDIGIDKAETPSISVYPNPTTIHITITGLPNEECTILLYDLKGSVIQRVSTHDSEIMMDISTLPRQVYAVYIFNNNFSRAEKIIKK